MRFRLGNKAIRLALSYLNYEELSKFKENYQKTNVNESTLNQLNNIVNNIQFKYTENKQKNKEEKSKSPSSKDGMRTEPQRATCLISKNTEVSEEKYNKEPRKIEKKMKSEYLNNIENSHFKSNLDFEKIIISDSSAGSKEEKEGNNNINIVKTISDGNNATEFPSV